MRSVLLVSFFLLGCAQPKYAEEQLAKAESGGGSCFRSGLCLSYQWETLPTEEAFGVFLFQTYRISGGIKTPEDSPVVPVVLLWMPSMGHGSSPVTVDRIATGSYRASKVFFTMKGSWEIRFQQKENQEVTDETILPVDF